MQVACASTKSNEVRIFDIGYISSDPVEVSVSFHSSIFYLVYCILAVINYLYIHFNAVNFLYFNSLQHMPDQ